MSEYIIHTDLRTISDHFAGSHAIAEERGRAALRESAEGRAVRRRQLVVLQASVLFILHGLILLHEYHFLVVSGTLARDNSVQSVSLITSDWLVLHFYSFV